MVVCLFTGGTISMRVDERAGGAVPALTAEEILASAPGVERIAQVRAEQWGRHPGPHMTLERQWALRARIAEAIADPAVAGIVANEERCREYAESSPSVVTPLNRYIGYEEAAKVAKQALAERKTIKDVVLERGYVEQGKLTAEQLDSALDVLAMTHP